MNTPACRVERIVSILFSDIQQSEAARRIGVAQPLLSRTLSGVREPSKTLIEKIAEHTGVNPRWLRDGIGEPLLDGYGTTLPVITELPRSAGISWPEVAAGDERFRISENQYSETRYWYRVTKNAMKSWGEWGQSRMRAKDGDYLLLETDPNQIQSLPGQARVAIVTHPEVAKGKPTWGFLLSDMRFFALNTSTPGKQSKPTVNAVVSRTRRKIRHPKDDTESNPDVTLQETKSAERPTEVVVDSEHVMAVVLEMTSESLIQTASD